MCKQQFCNNKSTYFVPKTINSYRFIKTKLTIMDQQFPLFRRSLYGLFPTFRLLLFTGWFAVFACLTANAQPSLNINGKIRDDKGDPVAGASIVVKGNNAGTSSDSSGNFKLTLSQARAVLAISSVGYQATEVTVTSS